MGEVEFIRCGGEDGACIRKISRAVIEGAVTADPGVRRSHPVPLRDGAWWAYRDLDGKVNRVYCPQHHPVENP